MGAADRSCVCGARPGAEAIWHPATCPRRPADEPLEPFADRREQAAAEDAMRATLPTGHPEALAQAWDAGYNAGDRDAYNAAEARLWNGRDLHDDELTTNPYRTAAPAGGGTTPATDRDTAREQIGRVLFRSGAEGYDLAIDMLLAEVVDPLLATIARVQAVIDWLNTAPPYEVGRRETVGRLQQTLDGGGT